jgi:hypothetical protein
MSVVGALTALFVVPALAQAAPTLRSGGEAGAILGVGAEVKGTSANLKFASNAGVTLECAENTLNGTVETNPGATVKINTATFKAAGGGAQCKTSTANLTAEITANPPWILHIEEKDKFTLTGPIKFTATLRLFGIDVATCVFESAAGVSGTYATGGPATLTVGAGQTFTKKEGGETCGTEGTLTGSFAPTSKGVPVWVTP